MDHFPPLETADEDGLLAIGGQLSSSILREAYANGIFPWYSGKIPMWYSPDPRFVLYPQELRVSKSMQQLLQSGKFKFTINHAFEEVIRQCGAVARKGQQGTWITEDMVRAYVQLNREGIAHSAETWFEGQLVGGLYGVRMGKVFCGESMFAHLSNASKFAFIRYLEQLQKEGVELIDCQVHTAHLESLGARMISRTAYLRYL